MELHENNRCFFCLSPFSCLKKENDLNCLSSDKVEIFPLQNICQLLNVKVEAIKLANDELCSNNVNVSLCGDCVKVGSKLSELFSKLVKIYLEADYYVGELQKRISGDHNRKETGGESKVLVADPLRKAIAQKCSTKRFSSTNLKVEISRECPKPGKTSPFLPIPLQLIETKMEDDFNYEKVEDEAEIRVPINLLLESTEINCIEHDPLAGSSERLNIVRTGNGKYKCSACDKEYIHSTDVSRHFRTAHLEKRYKCGNCGVVYRWSSSLKYHQLKCKTDTFENSTGTVQSNWPQNARYICSVCNKEYNSADSVTRHIQTDHLPERYKCNKCGVLLSSKSNFKRHQLKCNKLPQEMDNSMEKEASQNSQHRSILKATITHEGLSSRKKYKCPACDKEYIHSTDVSKHFRTAHLLLRFNCNKCGLPIASKVNLRKHQAKCSVTKVQEKMIKQQSYQFTCNICFKKFSSKVILNNHHMSVHLNLSRYPCGMCDKVFKYSGNRSVHRAKVHYKNQPQTFRSTQIQPANEQDSGSGPGNAEETEVNGRTDCGPFIKCGGSEKNENSEEIEAINFKEDISLETFIVNE